MRGGESDILEAVANSLSWEMQMLLWKGGLTWDVIQLLDYSHRRFSIDQGSTERSGWGSREREWSMLPRCLPAHAAFHTRGYEKLFSWLA